MQRFSLYRVHKVYPRTDGTTHARTHGTTAALLYPHRNALRGDNNFLRGANFRKKDKSLKNAKITSRKNFQVYSKHVKSICEPNFKY